MYLVRNRTKTFYEHSEDLFRVLNLLGDEHKPHRERISEQLFILGRAELYGAILEAVRLED